MREVAGSGPCSSFSGGEALLRPYAPELLAHSTRWASSVKC